MDSGSTYHATPYLNEIKDPKKKVISIQSVGNTIKSKHIGDVNLQITNEKGEIKIITLEDVGTSRSRDRQ